MPVMEGKAMLFKEFAGVDAFPLCLATQDADEIVAHRRGGRADVRRHQPRGHLGAALLRDRGAPAGGARHPGLPRRPARHGDRRAGGAAQRAEGRRQDGSSDVRGRVSGVGRGRHRVHGDPARRRRRATHRVRPSRARSTRAATASTAQAPARGATNPEGARGIADDVLAGADVFLGVSARARSAPRRSARWPPDPIVFAMAEPDARGHARRTSSTPSRVVATGRSRLPEPDQQRARFPGRLPRRARRARLDDRRGDEARGRRRDRGRDPARTSSCPTTSSRASSTATSPRRSPPPWRGPPRAPASPGARAGRRTSARWTSSRVAVGSPAPAVSLRR